ncbi:MAG: 50S ribosomal protein L11 methyltransferase [Kiritimatiellae bacterium]|nr:50S ribosomal protein L11 methyltransferase [Kiritimatiellia bacterium]MDW8458085.1 50S ribosomal protein L11 methyltransferase [Verrucomicrobiota bacterium]
MLTLEAGLDRAEDLAAKAESAWRRPAAILQRPDSNRAWIDIFFECDTEALVAALAAREWPGVFAAQPRLLKRRSWQTFWKHHFKAQDIGSRLRIQPAWNRRRPVRGRVCVLLDPGLSFGTGEHFTTRFCLEQLDRLLTKHPGSSVLDVGTGSGILALAAAKLGARRVVAIDHDPQAVAHARANARLNRLGNRIRFSVRDLEQDGPPRGRFDVVCANLYSRLLTRFADSLAGAARHFAVLSGIRDAELDAVAEAYIRLGLREVARDGDGEWGGLIFSWTRSSST